MCHAILKLRRKLLLAVLLFTGAVISSKAAPEQSLSKNALLIANAEYKGLGSLPNPIPDARLLSESLQKIGFNVVLLENANREQMLDAVDAFQTRLKQSKGISLFHFGGHGIQMDGRNYMIPAFTEIPDDRRLSTRAVDLEEVMGALDAAGSLANVVILDACRDNPLTARSRSVSRGLAAVQTQPRNTLVVYAAESGKKAEDGLFTPVLARTLAVPQLSLSRMLQQVRSEVFKLSNGQQTPGAYDQTFDEVFLNDGGLSTPGLPLPPPAPIEKAESAMSVPPPFPLPFQQNPQPPPVRPTAALQAEIEQRARELASQMASEKGQVKPKDELAIANQFLNRWLEAQNMTKFREYSALYHPNFRGVRRSGNQRVEMNRSQWLKDRGRMFLSTMTVSIFEVKVRLVDVGILVNFKQRFKQGNYQDEGPKVMVLVEEGNAVQVISEELLRSNLISSRAASIQPNAGKF